MLVHIAQQLPLPDRLNFSACCTALRRASLSSWFPEETVLLDIASSTTAQSLALWLQRYKARTHLLLGRDASVRVEDSKEAAARLLQPLAASDVAASCVVSLTPVLEEWRCALFNSAVLTPFTGLERLEGWNTRNMPGDVGHLFSLHRLTRLELSGSGTRGSWAGLRRLTALQSLDLAFFDGEAVLRALSYLTALTHLTLWFDMGFSEATQPTEWSWHNIGALSQLQELSLCDFEPAAQLVAAQLARLAPTLRGVRLYTDAVGHMLLHMTTCTHLTSLEFHVEGDVVELPAAALPHLAPLAGSLQHLKFTSFSIEDPESVLAAIAACSRLTYLHLPALAPSLARLSLAQCQLEVVPAELATLSRLTHLDLAGNSIVAGWRHLRALPQLVELQPPEARQHMQRG